MKGQKTGGRVQGTPNRNTADLRAKINTIVDRITSYNVCYTKLLR